MIYAGQVGRYWPRRFAWPIALPSHVRRKGVVWRCNKCLRVRKICSARGRRRDCAGPRPGLHQPQRRRRGDRLRHLRRHRGSRNPLLDRAAKRARRRRLPRIHPAAIESAPAFVLVLSRASSVSPFVLSETQVAFDYKRPISRPDREGRSEGQPQDAAQPLAPGRRDRADRDGGIRRLAEAVARRVAAGTGARDTAASSRRAAETKGPPRTTPELAGTGRDRGSAAAILLLVIALVRRRRRSHRQAGGSGRTASSRRRTSPPRRRRPGRRASHRRRRECANRPADRRRRGERGKYRAERVPRVPEPANSTLPAVNGM